MADSTFTFEIKGLEKLMKAFEESPRKVEPILQQAVSKSAAILAENTDSQSVPFLTGNLIRSFQPADIGRLFARWYPRANYAPYLQFGTSRGIKPRRYMEKILSRSKGKIDDLFKNALEASIDKIST